MSTASKHLAGYSASDLRAEALLILEHRGSILETAREVSRLLREAEIPGMIIGGIAVVLHGHVRTTTDVDVYLHSGAAQFGDLLKANGYLFVPERKEFVKHGVPVHLVLPEQTGTIDKPAVEMEGIATIALPDLINLKLRSGNANVLRAQDLADVIGLIRHHRLTGEFARNLDSPLRPAFRKFVRLVHNESSTGQDSH